MTTSRGAPRTQYARTYLLLPKFPTTPEGNSQLTQMLQAIADSGILNEKRWTMGMSADDAGLGDLDRRRVIAIDPQSWGSDLKVWLDAEYPGVEYVPVLSGGKGIVAALRLIG